uniref:Reverse transcriptase zinc-binding domain-containing protein n=1 Tax=Triticum urartu TaxID=4572 RepID=A0A8R7TBU0_TRIUA
AKKLSLNGSPDQVIWKLSKGGFTTKSVYEWLEKDLLGPNYKLIWKAKIPLKIKIFLWQLFQNAIPTRDNLCKRNWPGNPTCSFCHNIETADHLFFGCVF